ncbi:MAG: alpha-hydroxy-acid oxidizing protein [Atopobiaceae bacterium]|nr:alpha-hydroxy-acid oxidizing protein [Atopobiaceae bacterium]
MSYAELAGAARGKMGEWCRACPVCDGRACSNKMPGPGAKGSGTVAIRNYEAWQQVRVNMDTIYEPGEASCAMSLFGRDLALPVLVGPVGDVNRHYGPDYDTVSYNRCVLTAAADAGSIALTGDGMDPDIMRLACELIGELGGVGIPTIKPWSQDMVMEKLALAKASSPIAIAMDVDAAGLPFLKGFNPPAGPKSPEALREVVEACEGIPFIVKGIMTPLGAEKAAEAGVDAIVVSNHGGRVLDGTPATAEVLPEIAAAVGDELTVLVDGGIRSGLDVLRALALGADAVLACRPFVVATYGGGEEGVRGYLDQLAAELLDVMAMCGCLTLDDIDEECVFW